MDHLKWVYALFLLTASCGHREILREAPPRAATKTEIQSQIHLYKKGNKMQGLGGLSDLVYAAAESNPEKLFFYSLTDRGPNGKSQGEGENLRREFLLPDFTPQILKISYDVRLKTAELVGRIPLRRNGKTLTGLPTREETPLDSKGKILSRDPLGIDPEALAQDAKGHFWIGEEYGPDLLKVSATGEILGRWTPGKGLPAFLAARELNRGFEAITLTAQKTLLLFLQSEVPGHQNKLVPIVEFDPVQEKTIGLAFYPLDPAGGKIGSATLGPEGKVFVLEQNGKQGERAWQKVFALDFSAATKDLSSLDAPGIWKTPAGTVPVQKTERFDLAKMGLSSFEKLEGLAWTGEQGFAVVNDNDFEVPTAQGEKIGNFLIFVK